MEIFRGTDIVVLEDNPYRELRFSGTATDSFGKELGEQCCMLGTFSKIVAPGMRIGWVCVRNKELREKLLAYKATADLPVTINPDGIDCDALAAAVAANPDVKFAYVIPNFQNPTGLSYSQQVHDRGRGDLPRHGHCRARG